eukprot:m.240856 g.240856  ORF g.240856 m.240856 type:complete len:97 (-) comp16208_c0_seq1:44-334(-)
MQTLFWVCHRKETGVCYAMKQVIVFASHASIETSVRPVLQCLEEVFVQPVTATLKNSYCLVKRRLQQSREQALSFDLHSSLKVSVGNTLALSSFPP